MTTAPGTPASDFSASVPAVLRHLKKDRPKAIDRLKQFLSIPSVSTDMKYAPDVQRAAAWMARALEEAGLKAKVVKTPRHPVVLAHSDPAAAAPDAPRVLFYGHYDVQPPDPLEKWTTKPFEPTIRGGKIYARGAVDDKGQVMTFVESLRAWKAVAGGKLPVHVTALIEGEEECGSPSLHAFLKANQKSLAAPKHDFVLISDTGQWEGSPPVRPSITYGLRGLQYFDVKLHGPSRDLHSGIYGGTLANPATILVGVLGRLFDKDRRVTIPGFYDGVLPLSPAEKRAWAKLKFDEKKFLGDVGARPVGEKGFTTLERRWARPSCDVNGIYGGYMGEGAKTVIPSFAGAKVSFRLAAHQSAKKVAAGFTKWLKSQEVYGCRWEITDLHGADPVLGATDSRWIRAAARACKQSAGIEPPLVREGATIPVCIDFKRMLGLDSLLVGFGLNDDCIHSPNEKFNLDCFDLGCRTHAALLAELGKKQA